MRIIDFDSEPILHKIKDLSIDALHCDAYTTLIAGK